MDTKSLMLRAAVRHLLENERRSPHPERWSVQGFGMLRIYLDAAHRYRLNIWDDRLMIPGVSVVHDHPWHFESVVLSGSFHNIRYRPCGSETPGAERYSFMLIKTGDAGGPLPDRPREMWMYQSTREDYHPGSHYIQLASEIHESRYRRGSVTLNDRTPVGSESIARVFWPHGTEWVDAKPRPAAVHEIDMVLTKALEGMENA